jgi:hypothetical protein
MKSIRFVLICSAMVFFAALVSAQQLVPVAPSPAPGDTWGQLKVLPPHAHLHVAADGGGATCFLLAADDASLTCGRRDGSPKGQHIFPRAEVKSVKLTRYGISTLGGAAIGAGTGAVIGFATIRPHPNALLDFSGAARAICAVIGGVGGAAIGGPTDMFRGPTIYRRAGAR